eukprot:TRINITY_DN27518_c0_g1_i1.p1 TRINITY_DN27518_c0_g1~~TRINITY_DN27518_c0_g1_i1.p1  ORF type:complete len:195 (-),score=66.17 TRINITY_DN27518_c0_g1_i1:268-792(-)
MLRSLVGSEMCIRDRSTGTCLPGSMGRLDEDGDASSAPPEGEEAAQPQANGPVDPAASLATGIMQLLQPVVLESDIRVQAVMKSQAALAAEIDRLSSVLKPFLSSPEAPPFHEKLALLSRIRKRAGGMAGTIGNCQQRINRIQASLQPSGRLHYLVQKANEARPASNQEEKSEQ